MFNISKLVNKITERGSGGGGSRGGSSDPGDHLGVGGVGGGGGGGFVGSEEDQTSAEGFLCPPCMRAFPSPEELEAHYNATHLNQGNNNFSLISSQDGEDDVKLLREEIQHLQLSLEEEKVSSEVLKREVQQMVEGQKGKGDEDSQSHEAVKALLQSEIALLRKQLTDSLELSSTLKREREESSKKHEEEVGRLKSSVKSLEAQLVHKNSIDDASVLKQELVTVQRVMNDLTKEKEAEVEKLKEEINTLLESSKNSSKDENEKEALHQRKLEEAKVLIEELKGELATAKVEMERVGKRRTEDAETATQSLVQVNTQLNNANIRNSELQNEIVSLKEEVKRLNDQHSELYRRVEGGEGAKAAVEALQQENELLKENITNLSGKNAEFSTSLQQVEKQLETEESVKNELKARLASLQEEGDKLKKEISKGEEIQAKLNARIQDQNKDAENALKLQEKLKERVETLRGDNERYKKDTGEHIVLLREKEENVRELEMQCNNLSNNFNQKVAELSSLTEKYEKDTGELQAEINSCVQIKENQAKRLSELETEIESLKSKIEQESETNSSVKKSNETLLQQLEERSTELKQVCTSNQQLEQSKKELENALSTANKEKEETTKLFTNCEARVSQLVSKLKTDTEILTKERDKLKNLMESKNAEIKETKNRLDEALQTNQDQSSKLVELQSNFESANSKCKESENKLLSIQSQTESILNERIQLEKRLKLLEEEKGLLLEKCLSGESEHDAMVAKLGGMQRKLDDALSALQELGRENQSLQMESAKLQGRKWADDSLVNSCSTCTKEFTLTIRKHHCRACGQIFCGECSSRTAAVPSFKKPARVCDSCYQELLLK